MTSFPTAVKARENFGPRRIRGGKDLRNRTTQSTAVHERAAYAPGPKTPSEHSSPICSAASASSSITNAANSP